MGEELIQQLIKALDSAMPKRRNVAKNYVNPLAAMMLEQAGYQVKLRDGTIWKHEYTTNYGFAEFTRARHLQGLEAKESMLLINSQSWFLDRYNKLTGDSSIIPMDFWTGIPEQLTDTQRITSTPQDNANVVASRNKWANMFGDEVYVHHLERQVDLPIEVIRQYLYDPDFEARVEKIFGNEIANDLVRLAVNGNDVSFASGNFYKLLKSYATLLKEAKGTKTLVSGVSRFVGKHGNLITPVKVNAPAIRFIDPFSDDFSADTSANYTASAGALAVSGGKLKWTGTAWTGGTVRYNNVIPVLMNTNYVASIYIKPGATSSCYITIKDPAGNTIAVSNTASIGTSGGTIQVAFNSYNNLGVVFNVTCTQSSGDTDYDLDNVSIKRSVNKFEPYDLLNILDVMIDHYNPEYEVADDELAFLVSKEDASLIAKGLRIPVYVTDKGQLIPMATETRESRTVETQGAIQYRGYPIVVVPYAKSLNKGGFIIFGADKAEYRIAIQTLFSYNRVYNPRMEKGGEGYQYTYHFYQAYGVRNPGKFVIAEGIGSALTCEDLVFATSKDLIGSRIGSSASAVTIDKSELAAAGAEGAFVFCDTPGAEIFYSATSGNLDTYALASTQTPAEGVDFASLANNTYYVRAFLDGVTLPSTKMTVTVQA